MNRFRVFMLSTGIGVSLIMLATMLFLFNAAIVPGQAQVADADYEGSGECGDCHTALGRSHSDTAHGRTMEEVEELEEDEEDVVLADFSVGDDVRTMTFPDGDERAFTREDIAFTLGTGRYVQRYLYLLDEDAETYALFPAQWNTLAGEWEPYLAEGEWPGEEHNFNENCAYCHVTGLDLEDWTWEEETVECETCHGPGSVHIEIADEIRGIPTRADKLALSQSIESGHDVRTCGQCHSRGTSLEGDHGFPAGYVAGADLMAIHDLYGTDDADHWYAETFASEPNMQFNEWMLSTHADSVSNLVESGATVEASCLGCHSDVYRFVETSIQEATEDRGAFIVPELVEIAHQFALAENADPDALLLRLVPIVTGEDAPDGMTGEEARELILETLDIDPDDLEDEDADPLTYEVLWRLLEAERDAAEDESTDEVEVMPELQPIAQMLLPLLLEERLLEDQTVDAEADDEDEDEDEDDGEIREGDEEAEESDDDDEADEAEPVSDPLDPQWYGVTCASCHNPHSPSETQDFNLRAETYEMCVACHNSSGSRPTPGIHYPVQEMYEGLVLVEIDGLMAEASPHFTQEGGPECITCHMERVPVEGASRATHTMQPILPGTALTSDVLQDSCTECHGDVVDTATMQTLIDDIQQDTQRRLDDSRAAVTDDTPDWVVQALDFVEGDGSLGIHNYAYTDALLDAVQLELGLLTRQEESDS